MSGTGLSDLWLPMLVSAAVVFVVSSIIHMMLPWHKKDYLKVPDEDKAREAIRPLGIPPGDYMIPRPMNTQEMRSPEFMEKIKQGPNLIFTMLPNGPWTMTKNLVLWFFYALGVGVFAAYVTGRVLSPGAEYLSVFRFVGTTAFLAYSAALWQMSIWYHRSWATTFKSTMDGLIYALLTAGVFGWLWPR